jgi:curved DNA-binding protein CbpA
MSELYRQYDQFIDYYELMQISPNAEPATIERVYRMLAARYHPDNTQTGDGNKFVRLSEAYEVLFDPVRRDAYDTVYRAQRERPLAVFGLKDFELGVDGENNRRMGVLCLLYHRRRTEPERPGCSVLELEKMMSFAREHLLFTLWYLKDRALILQNESSDYVITGTGVDYVEENLPSNKILYKLLKASEQGETEFAGSPHPAEEGARQEDSGTV